MKRLISAALILAVLCSLPCFAEESAATGAQGAYPVSFDNIEQVWKENGQDYQKINSDLAIVKSAYEDLKDALKNMDAYVMSSDSSLVWSQYVSIREGCEKAKCAYDTALAQYDQRIQSKVLAAKQAFLVLMQDEQNLSAAQEKLNQKQSDLKNYSAMLALGYISQSVYDAIDDAVGLLEESVRTLNVKWETDLITFKSQLGLKLSDTVTFEYPELNESVFAKIADINLESDMVAMLSRSADIKVKQITYDSMKNGSYAGSYDIEGAKLAQEKAKTDAVTNFTLKYESLTSLYDALKKSYADIADEKAKLEREQAKYARGYSSLKAVNNLKLEYSSMEASVKVSECILYGAYLSYLNTLSGY